MIRKIHEKDKFIEAAYRIVSRYGFEELTVKRLSTYLQISTQPVYLNFKGIQEVKDEVIKRMYIETVYSIKTNINKEDLLHSAVVQLFENIFISRLLTNEGFNELTEDHKKQLFRKIIFVFLGMMQYVSIQTASSEEEIEQLCAKMLNDLLPEHDIL